jgi:hypothetical protein
VTIRLEILPVKFVVHNKKGGDGDGCRGGGAHQIVGSHRPAICLQ